MKTLILALAVIIALASVCEARGGKLLKRLRHPLGSCRGGACR